MNKQKKIKINVSDVDTGEYYELYKNVKNKPNYNNDKFIKFYFPIIDLLDKLTRSELTIIKYICNNIQINRKTIILTYTNNNLKKAAFYKSVTSLINYGIISKTDYQNLYIVNKSTLFNGKG